MSEQEFESYLRLMSRFLHLTSDQRDAIAQELRSHMEERLEDLLQQGYSRDDAIAAVLEEFGDAAALSWEFSRVNNKRKWIMRTTAGTIGIAAAVLIVSFLLPENRPSVPAPGYSHAGQGGTVADSGKPAASATTQPALAAGITLTPESEAERRTRANLSKVIPDVVFPDGTTFEEVITFLRKAGEVSIDVNWNVLESAGIDKTAPVSGFQLKDVMFESVLTTLLKKVGGSSGALLAYKVADGFLQISTREEIERDTVTRLYDCKDLIRTENVPSDQFKVVEHRLNELLVPAGPLSKPTLDTLLADLRNDSLVESEESIKKQMEDLEVLVKTHVFPGTWRTDGVIGSISVYDGILVITHNRPAHQKVAELIGLMRAAKVARGADESKAPMSLGGTQGSSPVPLPSKVPILRKAFLHPTTRES